MHKFWSSILNYNPKKYWQERGEIFHKENPYHESRYRIQEKKLLEYLSKLEFKTVLEVGCGFGRITKLLLENFEIDEYHATEYSPNLVEQTKMNVYKFKNINFTAGMIQDLEIEKKYDLVLGVEVLMHIKPEEVLKAIQKLVSFSKKHIVNVDWYDEPKPKIHARHNFVHDYEKMYQAIKELNHINKVKINGMKPASTLFHVQVNEKSIEGLS